MPALLESLSFEPDATWAESSDFFAVATTYRLTVFTVISPKLGSDQLIRTQL